jgi:hypothetical protein
LRDIIFIGHANPEDNEFTLWLQAKLKNEGYNVECDLNLTGGEEDYWKVLQDILDNKACKYLLILSKNTFDKSGVIEEWEQVRSISKKTGINDFVMILKIDDVPFNVRIGTNVKNHLRFDQSWAKALKDLIIKLHKDAVPKESLSSLSLNDWFKNQYSTNSGILNKKAKFYSNWLSIPSLPDNIYFYRYSNESQAEAIQKDNSDFPIIQHNNYLITFLQDLSPFSATHKIDINYLERVEIKTKCVFERYESKGFPNYDDMKRFIVRLLKDAFSQHLIQRGLQTYEMSQKTMCYYYKNNHIETNKVNFIYEGKKSWKLLIGDYFDSFWHYGISFHPLLYPELCYSIKAHVLFSDNGDNIWTDKKKLHKARRRKGKNWFNSDWRMLMLGYLHSLSDDGISIRVKLTDELILNIPTTTIMFTSDKDYEEPKSNARMIPVDYYEDDEIDDDSLDTEEEAK